MNLMFSLLFYVAAIIICSIVLVVAVNVAEKRIMEAIDHIHERQLDHEEMLGAAMMTLGYVYSFEYSHRDENGKKVFAGQWIKPGQDKSE
jgi:hypothetical protein